MSSSSISGESISPLSLILDYCPLIISQSERILDYFPLITTKSKNFPFIKCRYVHITSLIIVILLLLSHSENITDYFPLIINHGENIINYCPFIISHSENIIYFPLKGTSQYVLKRNRTRIISLQLLSFCIPFVILFLKNTVATVKFLNFGTPEIFVVIYLKFKQRGQT